MPLNKESKPLHSAYNKKTPFCDETLEFVLLHEVVRYLCVYDKDTTNYDLFDSLDFLNMIFCSMKLNVRNKMKYIFFFSLNRPKQIILYLNIGTLNCEAKLVLMNDHTNPVEHGRTTCMARWIVVNAISTTDWLEHVIRA